MTQQEIIDLDCKKHVKIYKLHTLGLKNSEVARLLSTNNGHVYNVLKKYRGSPDLIEKANANK